MTAYETNGRAGPPAEAQEPPRGPLEQMAWAENALGRQMHEMARAIDAAFGAKLDAARKELAAAVERATKRLADTKEFVAQQAIDVRELLGEVCGWMAADLAAAIDAPAFSSPFREGKDDAGELERSEAGQLDPFELPGSFPRPRPEVVRALEGPEAWADARRLDGEGREQADGPAGRRLAGEFRPLTAEEARRAYTEEKGGAAVSGRHFIWDRKSGKVTPTDLLAWGRWFATADRHLLDDAPAPGVRVSTVFLGLDHNDSRCGPPVPWETMVFAGGVLPDLDDRQERYATQGEAAAGHARLLAEVRAALMKAEGGAG